MRRLTVGFLGLAISSLFFFGSAGTVVYAATNTTSTSPATTTSSASTPSSSTSSNAVAISLTPTDTTAMKAVLSQVATELGYKGQAYVSVIPNPQKVATSGSSSSVQDSQLLYMGGNNQLEFNMLAWQDATTSSQKRSLTDFITSLQKSSVSQQGQQDVINSMESQDNSIQQMLIPIIMQGTSANLYTAMRVIAPFLPLIRLILGIGAIVIMLMLLLSTVVDLSFIGLPIFRESMNRRSENRGGSKVPFVSHDAVSCVNETELDVGSSGGYKNVYLIYLKRRIVTYIILSVCILYLVVGELGGVVAWLLHLASGTLPTGG